jgi:GNAT superfamily N-acetyltransferase
MNCFLSRFAEKNKTLGLSSTWVLLEQAHESKTKAAVVAYYSLASHTVRREQIPTDKILPAYPVPVVLLARLAVDKRFQKQGLGEKTLIYALRQCVALTDKGLPALGLVLDVLDDNALAFYRKFEIFQPFTDNPMRLFVPMNVIRQV